MITSNIHVADGWVNGAVGYLRYIEYKNNDKNEEIIRIWLQFPEKHIGAWVKSKFAKFYRENPHINSDWTPITKRTAYIHSQHTSLYCKRSHFPLFEAAALTIHKSQGSTYEKIIYEYFELHERAKVHVAMSRSQTLQNLYFTNASDDSNFYHTEAHPREELETEIQRLKNHCFETLYDHCFTFVSMPTPNDLSLCLSNIHSYNKHVQDLILDEVLTQCSITLLIQNF